MRKGARIFAAMRHVRLGRDRERAIAAAAALMLQRVTYRRGINQRGIPPEAKFNTKEAMEAEVAALLAGGAQ